jgi:hypothetical protein
VEAEFRRAKKSSEEKMTNSTRQQIEGDLHDAKGTAKEAAGKPAHDPDLEAEAGPKKWPASFRRSWVNSRN